MLLVNISRLVGVMFQISRMRYTIVKHCQFLLEMGNKLYPSCVMESPYTSDPLNSLHTFTKQQNAVQKLFIM